MNKILVIYNNPWIFAQSLSVLEELGATEYDILINEKYHNTMKQVEHSKSWLLEYVGKQTTDIDNIKYDYDIIIRPTPSKDDGLWFIYEKYPKAHYIYIEEWMWFYTTDLKEKWILETDKYFNQWDVYLTYPDKMKWAKGLNSKRVFEIVKDWYKKDLEHLPKDIKTIIFTEPIVFDEHDKTYKDKITKLTDMYLKPILIKRHFRDDTKYQYCEGVYECFNQIPWQLFFDLYPQSKLVFTGNTTLELYIHDKTRIIKI